jgi:adenylate cyclase
LFATKTTKAFMPFSDPKLQCDALAELERLIAARIDAAAQVNVGLNASQSITEIDAKIWRQFGQRRAVMFTDLTGFSRRVAEFGILHFLQVILESHRILLPVVEAHGGQLMKVDGDSMLIIFHEPQAAATCAVAMQRICLAYNTHRKGEEQVLLCIGMGVGDMLRVADIDVFGAEVNAAAKLGEDAAKSHDILVTNSMHESLIQLGFTFEPVSVVPPGASSAYKLLY